MRSFAIHNRLTSVALANKTSVDNTEAMLGAADDLTKIITDRPISSDADYSAIIELFTLSEGNILCSNDLVLPSVEEKGTVHLGKGITAVVTLSASGKSAIKEITISDEDGSLEAFVKEVAALRCCNHPNIIKLEAFNVSLGDTVTAQIQLPYYKESLSDYLSLDDTYEAGLQLVGTLDYLHNTAGMLHNDIKPTNIFYNTDNGQAILADFGVMKLYNGEDVVTSEAISTHIYTHPSVLEKLADDESFSLSPATDRWMLGVTLVETAYTMDSWFSKKTIREFYAKKIREEGPNPQDRWLWECILHHHQRLRRVVASIPHPQLRQLISSLLV